MKFFTVVGISVAMAIANMPAVAAADVPACDLAHIVKQFETLAEDDDYVQCTETTADSFGSASDDEVVAQMCKHETCQRALQKLTQLNITRCSIEGVTDDIVETLKQYANACNKQQ